jgi:two-component system, NarL family, nitrate/nitrite response regulator NarL
MSAMKNKIRVAVIDVYPLFREGVASTLATQSDIEVVDQGASAQDAARIARETQPDILLIEIAIPDGMAIMEEIALQHPQVRVLVLTVEDREEEVRRALANGARGYLLKGVGGSELIQSVRTVSQGDFYVSPSLAGRLLMRYGNGSESAVENAARFPNLSLREEQILAHLAQGLSNKEISENLYLSEKTIKHYVTNILQKLKVRNRVEAAILATGGPVASR